MLSPQPGQPRSLSTGAPGAQEAVHGRTDLQSPAGGRGSSGSGADGRRGLPAHRRVGAGLGDEPLNGATFDALREANVLVERWPPHYGTVRPHSALGDRPPAPATRSPGRPDPAAATTMRGFPRAIPVRDTGPPVRPGRTEVQGRSPSPLPPALRGDRRWRLGIRQVFRRWGGKSLKFITETSKQASHIL